MKSATFKNFQVGIVEDPSVEDQGGFEFASGMDIFSEPGVLKASNAMEAVSLGGGVSINALPKHMASRADGTEDYFAVGDKILKSSLGGSLSSFLTNSRGTIDGLGLFNGYVWSVAGGGLGRAVQSTAASQNDAYATFIDDPDFFPMIVQGGTFKIGAGRYVASVDESSVVTTEAMKLPVETWALALSNHFGDLFIGSVGAYNFSNPVPRQSTVFRWRGTVLSSGSALPDSAYPSTYRGMNALITNAEVLYGFPDSENNIYVFDGSRFTLYKKPNKVVVSSLKANHESVAGYKDTVVYSGNMTASPGVFQLGQGALCQAFVPVGVTPGASVSVTFGFVKIGYNNKLYIGFKNETAGTYHIERESSNKQNNAFVRTIWHRMGTDKLKRWQGVKLNLKTIPASCSVAVAYRTDRNAAFTDSGYTITSANQDKPIFIAAQPRSREIQFKFTYTTSTTNTPELISYDPIFEILKTIR